jgi:hypothetical protein
MQTKSLDTLPLNHLVAGERDVQLSAANVEDRLIIH